MVDRKARVSAWTADGRRLEARTLAQSGRSQRHSGGGTDGQDLALEGWGTSRGGRRREQGHAMDCMVRAQTEALGSRGGELRAQLHVPCPTAPLSGSQAHLGFPWQPWEKSSQRLSQQWGRRRSVTEGAADLWAPGVQNLATPSPRQLAAAAGPSLPLPYRVPAPRPS